MKDPRTIEVIAENVVGVVVLIVFAVVVTSPCWGFALFAWVVLH